MYLEEVGRQLKAGLVQEMGGLVEKRGGRQLQVVGVVQQEQFAAHLDSCPAVSERPGRG